MDGYERERERLIAVLIEVTPRDFAEEEMPSALEYEALADALMAEGVRVRSEARRDGCGGDGR